MKVRIVKQPSGSTTVEAKQYRWSWWSHQCSFHGIDNWNDAKKYATLLKHPIVEYIE